jgi:uncharacterized damage-inducible protein DinB
MCSRSTPKGLRLHVDAVVRDAVEKTLNDLLDAEADELCGAQRYERSPERLDTRAGHYRRKLLTQARERRKAKRQALRQQLADTLRPPATTPTGAEDRATVETDPSAVSGARTEAGGTMPPCLPSGLALVR